MERAENRELGCEERERKHPGQRKRSFWEKEKESSREARKRAGSKTARDLKKGKCKGREEGPCRLTIRKGERGARLGKVVGREPTIDEGDNKAKMAIR